MNRTQCIHLALFATALLIAGTAHAALPTLDDFDSPSGGQRAEATKEGVIDTDYQGGLSGVIGNYRHVRAEITTAGAEGVFTVSVNESGSAGRVEVSSGGLHDGFGRLIWSGNTPAEFGAMNLNVSPYSGVRLADAHNGAGSSVSYSIRLYTDDNNNYFAGSVTHPANWSGDMVFLFSGLSGSGLPSLSNIDRIELDIDTGVGGSAGLGRIELVPEPVSGLAFGSGCLLVAGYLKRRIAPRS